MAKINAVEYDVGPASESIKAYQIFFTALISILFTAFWLGVYEWLNQLVWKNPFVSEHRIIIPVGVMFFTILIGISLKYFHAPSSRTGGLVESIKGTEKINYKLFPVTLATSFLSLLSGASIGPEGALGYLISDISAVLRTKLRISAKNSLVFDTASLASAYNGIIGNPLFTAVFASEFKTNTGFTYIVWNLLAGVVGYLFFAMLQIPAFAGFLAVTPISELKGEYIVLAILLGIVGVFLAVVTGVLIKTADRLLTALFKENIFTRILFVGIIISIIGLLFPDLLFSGEEQIHTIFANPAFYGVGLLLVMALLKLILLGFSIKGGYLGGPTFPILFSSTMVALALSLLFPTVPIAIFVECIEVSALALLLGAPFTAILLVAVIGTADPYMIALLVVSTVVSMILGEQIKKKLVLQK
jgi:H+/Cl- antiporter ClcA